LRRSNLPANEGIASAEERRLAMTLVWLRLEAALCCIRQIVYSGSRLSSMGRSQQLSITRLSPNRVFVVFPKKEMKNVH